MINECKSSGNFIRYDDECSIVEHLWLRYPEWHEWLLEEISLDKWGSQQSWHTQHMLKNEKLRPLRQPPHMNEQELDMETEEK